MSGWWINDMGWSRFMKELTGRSSNTIDLDKMESLLQQHADSKRAADPGQCDTRPFFHVYGDTPMSRGVAHAQYRTFEDAKRKADILLNAAYILVHIRREEYDHEPGIEPELVVWAAASPGVDWQ
jgi:hypothetical protein